jgi:hypothetical protein
MASRYTPRDRWNHRAGTKRHPYRQYTKEELDRQAQAEERVGRLTAKALGLEAEARK